MSWTSFLVLATVFSKPQLMATLARVEKAAAEQYGKARLNLPGSSPWETLVRGGGHWSSPSMDMACQGRAALAGARAGLRAAPILGACAAGWLSRCGATASRCTGRHVRGAPVPGTVAVAGLPYIFWAVGVGDGAPVCMGNVEGPGRQGTLHSWLSPRCVVLLTVRVVGGWALGRVPALATAAAYTHALHGCRTGRHACGRGYGVCCCGGSRVRPYRPRAPASFPPALTLGPQR